MISCAIYGCTNNADTSDPSVQYYYFPKHPHITEQWLNACWREDEIDLNTARICSIHFDIDSYTTDYKMLDYNCVYAKLLKYDAIPTLYLPQSQTIIKTNISDVDLAISADPQTKNINIYVVDSPQYIQYADLSRTNVLSQATTITHIDTDSILSPHDVEFDVKVESPPEVDDPKYSAIKTKSDWEQLNSENAELENLIAEQEQLNGILNEKLEVKTNAFRIVDDEYKKAETSLAKLKRKSMSMIEQKRILSKVFSESQIKILMGKKKLCYWSNDDMAIGYTLRHISSKRFYMYLTKNLGIPMPALSSIKRWAYNKRSGFEKDDKELKKENLNDEEEEDSD